tara:strand:+ start:1956 stop:2756 length:801 start_codon:yes stop_codon:yes gene_type:complete
VTDEQRYQFDLWGYLHIPGALSEQEVEEAREASQRYVDTPVEDLPPGFGKDGKRHVHGFAFDKALERLALHPSVWPIVKELTKGRPRLSSGTLQVNIPGEHDVAQRLHCAKDDWGWDAVQYAVRDGRVFSDHIVVFPYLTDVNPGDGGLLAVPGSHKSMFERPRSLFNEGLVDDANQLPAGVVNITPKAGDVVIITEALTHGVLAWTPKDRNRLILVLRYHPQYQGNESFPDEIKERLSPETIELISKAGYGDEKEIVREDVVRFS